MLKGKQLVFIVSVKTRNLVRSGQTHAGEKTTSTSKMQGFVQSISNPTIMPDPSNMNCFITVLQMLENLKKMPYQPKIFMRILQLIQVCQFKHSNIGYVVSLVVNVTD